jgi:hypothetical protein
MTWRELVERIRSFPLAARRSDWVEAIHRDREPGMSRRTFLTAAGVAAVTIAMLPEQLLLDEAMPALEETVCGVTLAELDALLAEAYLPHIIAMLNDQNPLLRLFERSSDRRAWRRWRKDTRRDRGER